jgi:hypothetical protein
LARVILSDEQAKEIQKYYDKCTEEGANHEQIEESKKAMSEMSRAVQKNTEKCSTSNLKTTIPISKSP